MRHIHRFRVWLARLLGRDGMVVTKVWVGHWMVTDPKHQGVTLTLGSKRF
jgi:hypothetical protein